MTKNDLTCVRELHKKICAIERHLKKLRLSVENLTPILDGLPHASEAKSRVERLVLNIVEDERTLAEFREQFQQARIRLIEIIMREVDEPILQTLLIMHYAECLSFREISRRMRYGLRHIFKLHEQFLKDGIG